MAIAELRGNPPLSRPLLSRSVGGDGAELLHEREHVRDTPVLADLAGSVEPHEESAGSTADSNLDVAFVSCPVLYTRGDSNEATDRLRPLSIFSRKQQITIQQYPTHDSHRPFDGNRNILIGGNEAFDAPCHHQPGDRTQE